MALAARVPAHRVEAPGLDALGLGEAQLVERHRDLHHVALVGDPAERVPDDVPGEVLAARDVVLQAVELDAQRVDEELEGAPLVVERVQLDAHQVVVEDRVAVLQVGADRRRLGVVGAEGDVEAVVVVGHQALGLHRRRGVLARPGLVLEPQRQGLLPGRLVEDAVDRDRRGRPADLVDPGLGAGRGVARLAGRRGAGEGQQQPGGGADEPRAAPAPVASNRHGSRDGPEWASFVILYADRSGGV